jgi:hypothetical protein
LRGLAGPEADQEKKNREQGSALIQVVASLDLNLLSVRLGGRYDGGLGDGLISTVRLHCRPSSLASEGKARTPVRPTGAPVR